ncbi:hypothetical protein Cob_v002453 [Colletotrichum orbiculare MAFF 240422]|uniref:Uncharacterized protein n=1 Tax=Colletotrichum orbiculare (strain 104-T / ATCC 96160 / CBS 514.97 / LARS 414 / MAFF 240422) TaxID=1213857 RepID=A0A484G2S5_COLOR|nr:hypothetical protein Cob_v002453 [Colletotrichum orbiculare MAFF 240422]
MFLAAGHLRQPSPLGHAAPGVVFIENVNDQSDPKENTRRFGEKLLMKHGVLGAKTAGHIRSQVFCMAWLVFQDKLNTVTNGNVGLMAAREANAKFNAFSCGLFREFLKRWNYVHDLLLVALIESINEASELSFTKVEYGDAKKLSENIQGYPAAIFATRAVENRLKLRIAS